MVHKEEELKTEREGVTSKMRRLLSVLLTLMLMFSLVVIVLPSSVQAATFTVNSTGDGVDWNPGDGVAETAPGNGVVTLRAAIQEINALAGPDTINLPAGTYILSIAGAKSEVGWEKRTPKSGKIERRRCQNERDSARKVHEGISRGSGED